MGHLYVQWQKVKRITELMQDTRIKIAFCTQNTNQNILKPHTQTDKYNRGGIYQMKCVDGPLKYIGQTGQHLIYI
jgi:hypothetical protein